jgi:hypothetical protein
MTLKTFAARFKPMILKEIVEKALKVFHRHDRVVAVWLFGSAAEERMRVGSDLDLAVLFQEKPPFEVWADLRADLQEALKFEDIDLVTLNEAHPILRFEAVRGKCLYCVDPEAVAAFVSLSAREYEDTMAFLERGRQMTAEVRQHAVGERDSG